MPNLYNLAYISKNTIKGDSEKVREEIKSILASAHKNNPDMGVTGALLYSGGYFCQVIEGPEDVLEELYETIQMDDRHGEVTVLHFEPIEERGFSEWAMALAGIEDDMRFDLDGVLGSKDELKMKETGKDLVAVLEKMVKQHQSVLSGSA
ncbi:BLUF domain-containing protein [Rhodobacteraceae bacterium HSP-20]|uniref:BLUF domain-containing protein n=1 Tax=Paragemmobacter amnigenus TaxID=2852097 RepID=A0ABS6J8M0_9RHOB|nr:BLUF domain-containing protein [Rhodobacter amnigenus]MBU9699601.1 BLUF domain-containing protein [Rhodobacter amnigenus]MBV4390828.1 BLUF domain-containing protein [Rhodobacter amnigenus]